MSKNKSSKKNPQDKPKKTDKEEINNLESSFGSALFSAFDSSIDDFKGSFFSKSIESRDQPYFDNLEGLEGSFERSIHGEGDMNQAFVEENSRITVEEEEKVMELESKQETKIKVAEEDTNYTNRLMKSPTNQVVAIEGFEVRQK